MVSASQSVITVGQHVASLGLPSTYGIGCLNRLSIFAGGHSRSGLRTAGSIVLQGGGLKGSNESQLSSTPLSFWTQSGLEAARLTSSDGSAVMLNR